MFGFGKSHDVRLTDQELQQLTSNHEHADTRRELIHSCNRKIQELAFLRFF